MDTKQAKWFARADVYGIGESFRFEGPLQVIARDFLIAMMNVQGKAKPGVGKEITLLIRSEPITDASGQEPEWMGLIDLSDVEVVSDEELDAMYADAPWLKDPKYLRFAELNMTQANFMRSPDEYRELWDYFESKYPDVWKNRTKRSF